jgi:hypothetical protein
MTGRRKLVCFKRETEENLIDMRHLGKQFLSKMEPWFKRNLGEWVEALKRKEVAPNYSSDGFKFSFTNTKDGLEIQGEKDSTIFQLLIPLGEVSMVTQSCLSDCDLLRTFLHNGFLGLRKDTHLVVKTERTHVQLCCRFQKKSREWNFVLKLNKVQGEYDDIACEACRLKTNEDVMLLCDSCNDGFHTFCLKV